MSEEDGKKTSATLREARRIVVKVGSSLVTNEGRGLDEIPERAGRSDLPAADGREFSGRDQRGLPARRVFCGFSLGQERLLLSLPQ